MPVGEEALEQIAASFESMARSADDVAVMDEAAIEKLAAGADPKQVEDAEVPGIGLPLRFDDLEAEVNFYGLMHALDFGSGWEKAVEQQTGRPFNEVVLFGLMGMHLDGNKLDAQSLAELTNFHLGVVLQMPVSQEVEVMPAIRQDRDSDLKPLVDKFHGALQQIARRLQEKGFTSLGQYILAKDEHGFGNSDDQATEQATSAARIVTKLSRSFSSFCDEYEIEGQGLVSFHRKASLLAMNLHNKFQAQEPQLRLADVESVTVGSEMKTASLLIRHGILKLDNGLAARLSSDGVLKSGSREEVGLRACSAFALNKLASSLSSRLDKTVSPAKALSYLSVLDESKDGEISIRCVDTAGY